MSLKDDYQRKIETQLKQWNAEINLLKARAQNAEADAKINQHKEVEELKSKKDVVVKRLDELKMSRTEVFEELKDGIDKACAELEHGFTTVLSRLK